MGPSYKTPESCSGPILNAVACILGESVYVGRQLAAIAAALPLLALQGHWLSQEEGARRAASLDT